MHLKFLARGTGSAAAAAAYLLAKRDAAGTERAAVEVLRGDPLEVARVADGLPFKYVYTSGVIAWSLEDNPPRAEIEWVLDEFEKTAWAGLERDRYIWSAVLHRDHDGGVHVHILAARCDLATGRSLNIAPPGWQKTFDPLRDAFNYECGWSRPDDPARERPYRPSPHRAYLDAETLRAGWEVEPDRRALIGEHLLRLVADGAVKDRDGVVAALEGLGFEVPRHGRHYVTILQPATGERLRLKGGLYEADLDPEKVIRSVREPSVDREPADRGDDATRAAEAWRDLEERRLKRAEYHLARYGRGGRVRGGVRAAGDVERESGRVAAAVERAAAPESLAEHLREELGDEAVVAAVDSMAERGRDVEASRGAAAGDATACLAVLARVGVVDDRDRATADDGVAGVVHAVRAGAEAAGRTDRGLAGAGRGLAATVRSARACGDALDRGIRDAGRDLWRTLRTRVAGLEEAVCATSKGGPWLVEAQEAVLEGADRRLTLAARARAVKTVEGRLSAELADREEALRATSAGAVMLREEYGERIASAARPQSFASREDVLTRIETRVDAELEAQEEALRSIPLGKQYLSEAEQARTGEQPPPLAERESTVTTATERVEEEFDKREKRLAGVAGNENLLVEAAGDLDMAGGTLTLGERWRAIESAERWVEAERAELEGREAAILEDPAGAVFLSDARREIFGAADREANTLADRGRVLQAAEALQKAAAKRQADQAWEKEKTARERALARRLGGTDLYHAHLAALDPQWSLTENNTTPRENIKAALGAAESDGARLDRLRVVLSDEAGATRYREELDKVASQFTMLDLDRALAAGERAQADREASARRAAELDTATEEAQAAAARSNIELPGAHVRAIYETGETHESGLSAVERTTAALAAAADQQLPTATIIDTWKANVSAPGGIADALAAATAVACEERVEALATGTAAARAAAMRSAVKLPAAEVHAIYETGETHESGLSAVERTTAALAAAADQQLPTATIIETWNANKSSPGGIAAALVTKTRVSRLERLLSAPRAAEAFIVALDRQDPSSRTPTHPNIDRALDIAEREFGPGASSATGRRAGDGVTEAADTDRDVQQQVIERLRTEVQHQQFASLRARTGAARLDQRNRHSLRWPVVSPPVPKPDRLVPDATWEDAVAAALVRARLPGAEQQELRLGVDLAARELAGESGGYQWWSHADGELDKLHRREDRYREFGDTKEGPVEIGMLRTVLERDVYEKAYPLVEHPAAEPNPPPNLVELVRAFIRRLQYAVDRLIDRVLEREPAQPPRPAAAVAPAEPSLRQPVSSDASPPPATAPAPEPAAVSVTEVERVRVAVHFVEAKLPRTNPYPGNSTHRPPALSDERLDHLAAATDDEFVKMVIAELQRRQGYYTDSERSESEKRHLRPDIAQKNEENQHAYKEAEAARSFFSRRPPEPTWAEAESVVIKEFETKQLVLIEGVCRTIQQRSPATIRHEFQRMEPERAKAARLERDEDLSERSSHIDQTKARDRDPGQIR